MDEPAIGIDLGTSNTVIAVVQGSEAVVIPDAAGRRTHPSIVSFHPSGSVLVGHEAKDRRVIDPVNTVSSAKRLIGRPFPSRQVQTMVQRMAYAIEEGENQEPLVVARGNRYSVSELSALVLRHVCSLAERHIGQEVKNAVITVPANFNDAQREATRVAGQVAGLNVLRVLNEPTAAALAYGYGRGMASRVAVYDFGGGTFDITLLQLDDQVFEVLATAGDTFLGGDDLDEQIVEKMVHDFVSEHRVDLRFNSSAMVRLRGVAEQLKCQLSGNPRAVARIQEIAYGDSGEPLDFQFELTDEALKQMADDLIKRTFLICDESLRLANTATTQIDDVVMVGGMTRMPAVREGARHYFNNVPRTDINPDEVVAVGAAIQAAVLTRAGVGVDAGGTIRSVLLDVVPRALGMGVVSGFTETIIRRNAQIPMEQTRRFTTSRDEQTVVRIQICQGEARLFEDNQPLGELLLEGIRSAPRGQVQVEVTFEIDTDGILQVSAVDLETKKEQRARVKLLGTVGEDKIEEMARRQDELPMSSDSPDPP